MELSGYTMSELIKLREEISNYILNKKDGFLYLNYPQTKDLWDSGNNPEF